MVLSIIDGVFLQDLIQHLAGILLAVAHTAVEGDYKTGRDKLIVLLSVFQLGLLYLEILLGDHGLHLDIHPYIVRGCLRILDSQGLHRLADQVRRIDFRGIYIASVRRKAFGCP